MSKRKSLLFLAAAIVLMLAATLALWPWFASLGDAAAREAFIARVHAAGIGGVLLMLGVQMVQVVLAVIPGEPVEIIAGALYGAWGGLALCLVGTAAGSAVVFFLVRRFGTRLVGVWFDERKIRETPLLRNPSRLLPLTFILFFIPGTPKDLLTYVAGLTPIRPLTFLCVATVARVPSIISSTLAGSSIGQGNFMQSLWIFAATGVVALLGMWAYNRMSKKKPDAN